MEYYLLQEPSSQCCWGLGGCQDVAGKDNSPALKKEMRSHVSVFVGNLWKRVLEPG